MTALDEGHSLSSNILGLIPLAIGLLLSLYSHRAFLSRLNSESLRDKNALVGLFALRATLYLLTGGLILALIGAISLLGFIPWA